MMTWLKKFLGIQEPKTHDYFTHRGWGHDYTVMMVIDGGMQLRACGWGHGLEKGDYILLRNDEGNSTRYRIERLTYMSNPRDMWSASLRFAPRMPEEKARDEARGL